MSSYVVGLFNNAASFIIVVIYNFVYYGIVGYGEDVEDGRDLLYPNKEKLPVLY